EAAEVSLTMVGPLMGTVEYVAPEHAANPKHADHRSDIYSLGCTMYRLLTGRLPYGGETAVEKVIVQREHPIPELSKIIGDIPEKLQGIFARMVAKAPEDRYQSMDACLADLLGIAGQAEHCDISGLTNMGSSSATTVCDEVAPEAETTIGDDIEPAPATLDAAQTDSAHSARIASTPQIAPAEGDEPTAVDAPQSEVGYVSGDEATESEAPQTSVSYDDSQEPTVAEIPEDEASHIDSEESAAETPEADSEDDDDPDDDDRYDDPRHGLIRLVLATIAVIVGVGVGIGLKTYFASVPAPAPSLSGQWSSLLQQVDLESETIAGKWDRLHDGSIMAFVGGADHSMMTVGSEITPNYQVRMRFTRHEGMCGVGFNLPLGLGKQVSLEIDGDKGARSALGDADYGVRVEEDGPVLSSGVKHTCIASVESARDWTRIMVTLDGRELIKYEGPISELHPAKEWVRPANRLGFGVHRDVSAQIHELSVRAFSGGRFVEKPSTQP
ncbi:MAG: hypothetical protein QGG25_14635, partial [Phycisphaerae bacterium]|nr:hypothetical protein [Phycisphaerae bacterium]